MAILKPKFDQYSIDILKIKLSEKTGFVIANKPDCAKLSEIITQNGNGYISEATLYRLFLKSEKHTPYKNTLDLLCTYLGFKDCFDFLDHISPTKDFLHRNGTNTTIPSGDSLIFYCIENRTYKPLNEFFDALTDSTELFKETICISLFDSLQKSKKQIQFFKHFADHHYVREFFLEKGHDPRFRIKNYDFAYLRYIEKTDPNKSLRHFQDYIFGNAVLLRYFFLNHQHANALKICKKLYSEISDLEPCQKEMHLFPFMRFTAYKLWFLQMSDANKIKLENYAFYLLDLLEKLKPEYGFYEQKILFHTLAETFVNSNLPESFHQELKKTFVGDSEKFPYNISSKHLKYSLPYLEPNGLIYHRP